MDFWPDFWYEDDEYEQESYSSSGSPSGSPMESNSDSDNISAKSESSSFDIDDSRKHMCHLSSHLNQFRSDGTLCDVKLKVGTKTFHAHKAILSAASDYFLVMFTAGFQESCKNEICMEGNGNIFGQLLDYVYTGKICLNRTTVLGILQMASYLQLTEAKTMCQAYLKKIITQEHESLDLDELLEIWHVADTHGVTEMDTACAGLMFSRLCQVINSESFYKRATCDQILKCLDDEWLRLKGSIFKYPQGKTWFVETNFWLKIACHRDSRSSPGYTRRNVTHMDDNLGEKPSREIQMLTNITLWLIYDWDRRHVYAGDLLKKIHLGSIPTQSLYKILDTQILDHPECKALLKKLHKLQSTQDAFQLKLTSPEIFAPLHTFTGFVSIGYNLDFTSDRNNGAFYAYNNDSTSNCRWQSLLPVPYYYSLHSDGFHDHAVLNVYGKFYVAGGGIDRNVSKEFLLYDKDIAYWTRLKPMLRARGCHAMAYLDNNIYVIGGASYDGQSKCFSIISQQYNIITEKWHLIANLRENVEYPSAVAFKGMLVVLGQKHIIGDVIECILQVYDPSRNTWFLQEAVTRFTQPSQIDSRENFPTSKLSIQEGECYQVWYESVNENDCMGEGPFVSHVNKLVCDFDGNHPSVTVGNSEDQSMIPPNDIGACSMNKMIYVDMNGTFHRTGIRVKEGPEVEMVNLHVWSEKPCSSLAKTAAVIFSV